MSYPRHVDEGPHRRRPCQPPVPGDRGPGPEVLGRRRHLRGQRRAAIRRHATATTSSSSTTARRSPTACRTTATCSPATSRTSSPATRRCAAAGSSAASAGTATACPPRSRPRSSSGITHKSPDRGPRRRRQFNDACRTSVLRYTQGLGASTSPARPAGSTSTTTTRRSTSTTWRASCGRSRPLGQGPGLRGLPGAARTAGGARRRCPTPRRGWTTSTGSARTRRVTVWFPLDDRASSCSSGRRRRGPCRRNLALAVGPDIDYAVVERRRATSYVLGAGRGSAHYARELGAEPVVGPQPCKGSELVGRRYTPAVRLLRRPGERVPGAGRRLRDHRGRHRAPSTSRPPSARTTRPPRTPPASTPSCPSTSRAGSPREVPPYAGQQVFEANRPIIRDLQAGLPSGAVLLRQETYDHPYPHCWRCDTPLIYKAVSSLVRRGDRVQGPDGRAEPADQLGARAHQGRLVRQVAGERPRLVDQPQPVLGQPDPGVGQRRPAATRGSTSTAASTSSSATSACARPTCTGRSSTS